MVNRYFPEWIQVLVREEANAKPEWQGLSGQLRSHGRELKQHSTATVGSSVEVTHHVHRQLNERIATVKEDASVIAREHGAKLAAVEGTSLNITTKVEAMKKDLQKEMMQMKEDMAKMLELLTAKEVSDATSETS